MAHENHHTRVPSIHWLGIKSQDLADGASDADEVGLLPLTARERRKAVKMLENGRIVGERRQWRREVQVMLILGFKAEIQILSGRDGGLEEWIEREIGRDVGEG